jgi:predicted outer membrane repeat protein
MNIIMPGNYQNYFNSLLLIAALVGAGHLSAEVIYVNVNNLNPIKDGTSWRTAFNSLQDGLDAAEASPGWNDIWVARGVYFPSKIYSPNGVPGGASGLNVPALATFNLPDETAILGGFKGTEVCLNQRDPQEFRTVLSGAGTSWHVVTLGNDIAQTGVRAKLDGLIITEGNAQGPDGAPTFEAPFTFGHSFGAGVYVAFNSSIFVEDVLFVNNVAAVEGGAFFSNNSIVQIDKSAFLSNSAGTEGGAIEILNTFETSPHYAKIHACIFKYNTSVVFGGAIVAEGSVQNSSSFTLIDGCSFKYNYSQVGGAIAVDSLRVDLKHSSFKHNIAAVAGGAISTTNIVNTFATGFLRAPFTPFTTTISNCKFSENVVQGNQALHDLIFGGPAASGTDFPFGGGAIAVYINGYLDLYESEFYKNYAQNSEGGAILNGNAAGQNIIGSGANGFIVQTNVTRCSFKENQSATENGGGIASMPSSFPFPTPLPITVADTVLNVSDSSFKCNFAGLFGGGIYLNLTTATLMNNCFKRNHALLGKAIFGINSIINGDTTSPVIIP